MKKYIFLLAAVVATLSSCGDGNKFKISGVVDGAEEETLWLQSAINGRWITLDSVKTDDNGKFSLRREAPRFPEVYRLVLGENAVYFPIDSIESITLNSTKSAFGVDYTLEGSDNAVNMMNVDKKVRELQSSSLGLAEAIQNREKVKRELTQQILVDPSSILAYYIINKHIDDQPLFSTDNNKDVKVIGAVANAYYTYKPNDPRTALLVNTFLVNRKVSDSVQASSDTLYAEEAAIIEVSLPDENGKVVNLSEVTSKRNVVVLNFTALTAEESPEYNKILSDIYKKYKSKGFEIYQIAFDPDITDWKLAAMNLPWITVYDEAGANSRNLQKYNVGLLPMTYIIDRNGEIVSRVLDHTTLDREIAKLI